MKRETERLILREMQERDLDALSEMLGDPRYQRYLHLLPIFYCLNPQ